MRQSTFILNTKITSSIKSKRANLEKKLISVRILSIEC